MEEAILGAIFFSIIYLLPFFFLYSKGQKRHSELINKVNGLEKKVNSIYLYLKELSKSGGSMETKPPKTVIEKEKEPEIPPIPKPQIPLDKNTIPKKTPLASDSKVATPTIASKKKVESSPMEFILNKFNPQKTDWEKFIGENIAGKLGIGILVLGIAFLVKFGIDNDWINEVARVSIGVIAGAILLGLGHYFHKTIPSFSSLLVGGGLAVEYITISIAFHIYQLFPSPTIPFIIMVALTGFAILLSYTYDRQELAVISMIGGLATPFLVSTGEGNYIVLFTYLLILNSGILILSYLKNWKILNFLSVVLTIGIFLGWLFMKLIFGEDQSYVGAFIFAGAFYILFYITNLLQEVKPGNIFPWVEYSLLFLINFFFLGVGLYLLEKLELSNLRGVFSMALAIVNFVIGYFLFVMKDRERIVNYIYMVLGLVALFVTLTIPLQFKGNFITLFWAAEALLIFWIAGKTKMKYLLIPFAIIGILTSVSWIMDIEKLFQIKEGVLPVFFNGHFLTGFFLIIVSAVGVFLSFKSEETKRILAPFLALGQTLSIGLLLIIVYITFLTEITFQDSHRNLVPQLGRNWLFLFHSLYGIALCGLYLVGKQRFFGQLATSIGGIIIVFSTLLWNGHLKAIINGLLNPEMYNEATGSISGSWWLHYLPFVLILILIGLTLKTFLGVGSKSGIKNTDVGYWVISVILLSFLSIELLYNVAYSQLGADFSFSETIDSGVKIAFPVLWGSFSFILMAIGLRKDLRILRLISIAVMVITLVKLFFFDLKDISDLGKIISFSVLGAILVTVSFLYKKLKMLILEGNIEDEKPNEEINDKK